MTGNEKTQGRRRDGEQHAGSLVQRPKWLRAGVLGANDGAVALAATFAIGMLLHTGGIA